MPCLRVCTYKQTTFQSCYFLEVARTYRYVCRLTGTDNDGPYQWWRRRKDGKKKKRKKKSHPKSLLLAAAGGWDGMGCRDGATVSSLFPLHPQLTHREKILL